MSMKVFRLSSFLFAFALAAAAFCFDSRGVAGSAISQNANSSTTMPENTNAGTTRRKSGRRRKAPAPPAVDTTAVPATEPSASAATETTEQTDLSGTYTGTFDCSDAGLTGETTLTITGNQFTTSDGKSGRITAATTRGYTGVAMQFGELTLPANGQPGVPPTIVSMRARKSRDRLTLTSVLGATRVCSFTPTGAVNRSRRQSAAATAPAEAAKPAPIAEPVSAPVTPPETVTPTEPVTPEAEAGPMPPAAAPAAARKGRRATAKSKPAPATPPN